MRITIIRDDGVSGISSTATRQTPLWKPLQLSSG